MRLLKKYGQLPSCDILEKEQISQLTVKYLGKIAVLQLVKNFISLVLTYHYLL